MGRWRRSAGPASPRWSTPSGAGGACPNTRSCPAPTSTTDRRPAEECPSAAPLEHTTRRQQVIYVEHHTGPEQTDVGRIDWQPGWYAICDDCGWMAGPCPTEADAHAAADAHDLA